MVGVFAGSVLVDVGEELCAVGDGVVDGEGCALGDDAGVLVVEVSCGVDEVVGVVAGVGVAALVTGAVLTTPWRGTRILIGWTSTGISG